MATTTHSIPSTKPTIAATLVISFCSGAMAASPVVIDFNTDASGNALPAGTILSNQYALWGVAISADNLNKPHDIACVFDSNNPSGGDADLQTPNPGGNPNNTIDYGNLMIIAENDVDSNADGLIDDPDDEGYRPSGILRFQLTQRYGQIDLILVDGEETGSIVFKRQGTVVHSDATPIVGDSGVASLTFSSSPFAEVELHLGGSGAVAQVTLPRARPAFSGWREMRHPVHEGARANAQGDNENEN